jgi:hypothetical protein
MAKTIQLTQGKVAIVDDADYDRLNAFRWYASNGRSGHYASRCPGRNRIPMHREVMGASAGQVVDHKNGNTLDNRRENLRLCLVKNNAHNQKRHSNNSSGYKGVHWHSRVKKWAASIMYELQAKHLGYFKDPRDAAEAYDRAALHHFGEYAFTNFPLENYL